MEIADKKQPKPQADTNRFYDFWYDFAKVTGSPPVWLWMRPKVYYPYGKPKLSGAAMISANHPSHFDPILLLLVFFSRRLDFLATKDFLSTPARARFFKHMRCINVDKENFSLASFHEVVTRLKNRCTIVIFPEGQLNKVESGNLLSFKSGVILMAHKAEAPILPVYIVKPQKWYHRQRIVIGQPLHLAELLGKMPSIQQLSEAGDLLREKEVELQTYYNSLSAK